VLTLRDLLSQRYFSIPVCAATLLLKLLVPAGYRPALVVAIVGRGIYTPLSGLTLLIVTIVERVLLRRLPRARLWLKLVSFAFRAA